MGAPKVQEVQVSDPDSLITSIFSAANLTPPITSESGYIFQGWGSTIDHVEPDLTLGQLMSMYHNIPDVVDVYAVYRYQSGMVQLTINPNGGTWKSDNTTTSKVFSVPVGTSLTEWMPFYKGGALPGNGGHLLSVVTPPLDKNAPGPMNIVPVSPGFNPFNVLTNTENMAVYTNATITLSWNSYAKSINYVLNPTGMGASNSSRPNVNGVNNTAVTNAGITYDSDGMTLKVVDPSTEWFYSLINAWTDISSTPLLPGKTYTISVDAMGTVPQVSFRINDAWVGFYPINNNTWTRVSATFTNASNATKTYIRVNAATTGNVGFGGFTAGQTLKLRNFKLEDDPSGTINFKSLDQSTTYLTTPTFNIADAPTYGLLEDKVIVGGRLSDYRNRVRGDYDVDNPPRANRGKYGNYLGDNIRRIYWNLPVSGEKRLPKISDLQGFNIQQMVSRNGTLETVNKINNSRFMFDSMGLYYDVNHTPVNTKLDTRLNWNPDIPGNEVVIRTNQFTGYVYSVKVPVRNKTRVDFSVDLYRNTGGIERLVIEFLDDKFNIISGSTKTLDKNATGWQYYSFTNVSVPSGAVYFHYRFLIQPDVGSTAIRKPFLRFDGGSVASSDYVHGSGDWDQNAHISDFSTNNSLDGTPIFDFTGKKTLSLQSVNNPNKVSNIEFIGSGSTSQDRPAPGIYVDGIYIYNKSTLRFAGYQYNRAAKTDTPIAGDISNPIAMLPGGSMVLNYDGTTSSGVLYSNSVDDQLGMNISTPDESLDLSGIKHVRMVYGMTIVRPREINNNFMNAARYLPSYNDLLAELEVDKEWVEVGLQNGYKIRYARADFFNIFMKSVYDNTLIPVGKVLVGWWSASKKLFIPQAGYSQNGKLNDGFINYNRTYEDYTDLVPVYHDNVDSSTTQVHLAEKLGGGLFYSGTVNERKDVTYSVNNTDNWSQAINYAPQITFNDHKPLYWRNSDMMPLTVQRVDATTVAEPKWMLEGTVDLYRKPREFFLIDRSTIFDGWLYMDKFNLMDKESIFVLDPTGLGAEYEDQNSNNIDGWAKAKQQLTNNDISFKAYYKGYAEYQRLGQWMTGKDLVLATLNETGEPTYWMVSKKNIEKTEITEGDDWLVGTITFTKQSPGFDIETLGIGTDSVIDNNDMNPRRNTYVYIKSTQLGTAVRDSYVLATNLDTGEQVIDKLNGTIPAGSFIEYSTIPYNELWAYGSKWGDYPNNLYSNIDPVNSQPIKLGPGRWDIQLSSGDSVTIGSLSPNKISAYQGRTIASQSGKLTNDSMVGMAIKEKEF